MKIFSGKEVMMPPVRMFWLRPQPDKSYKLCLMEVIRFRKNDLWFLTRNRALQLRSFFELNPCYSPPMLMMIEYEGYLYPFHKTLFPRFDVYKLEQLFVKLPESRLEAIEAKRTRTEQDQRIFVEHLIVHRIHQCQRETKHQLAFTQRVQDALGMEMTPKPISPSSETLAALSDVQHELSTEDRRKYCPNCNTVYLIPLDQAEFICDSCGSPVFCRDLVTHLPSAAHGTFKKTPNLQLPKMISSPIRIGTWEPNEFM